MKCNYFTAACSAFVLFLASSMLASTAGVKRDVIQTMIDDGCALPIARDIGLPSSCVSTFFSDYGVVKENLPNRVANWGSNGRAGQPWSFAFEHCDQVFIDMFEKIAEAMPSVSLSPHDLFHGHMINDGDRFLVVFHAKEYPADLEPMKNIYQLPSEMFFSAGEDFQKRNFVYVSEIEGRAAEEILLIENRGLCERYFSDDAINTFSEKLLTQDLTHWQALGDGNMFVAATLSRLKYQFYPGLDEFSGDLIEDMEWLDTGMSQEDRLFDNDEIDIAITGREKPIIYFMTGR